MNMPKVKSCDSGACAYNKAGACHALAVTIGDADRAACDTFVANMEGGHAGDIAGVGACKLQDCVHNDGLYCMAAAVEVKNTGDGPVCATYSRVADAVSAK